MFFVQYRTLTDKLGFFSVKNPQEIIFIGKLSILKFSLLKRSRKANWLAKRKRIISSFIVKKRAKKVARNISKNTTITIPEHNIPAFKPAKSFAAKVK